MTCKLYRHYDADGNLLYVGISLSAVQRLSQHHAQSEWETKIVRVAVEHYPDRECALRAEATAINDENPIHNKQRPVRPPQVCAERLNPVRAAQEEIWGQIWTADLSTELPSIRDGRPRWRHGKGGRPRIENTGKTLSARKPWMAEGISRASWYRKKPLTA